MGLRGRVGLFVGRLGEGDGEEENLDVGLRTRVGVFLGRLGETLGDDKLVESQPICRHIRRHLAQEGVDPSHHLVHLARRASPSARGLGSGIQGFGFRV